MPERIKNNQFDVVNELNKAKLFVIKHIITAKIITTPVRKNVAKFELTFFIPTLANIVVRDVKSAPIKAITIHINTSPRKQKIPKLST